MNSNNHHQGFTLVELMITVAIVGVLAGIALPAYNGYITTSKMGVATTNAELLSGFEDAYFYENGTYLAGAYSPPGIDTLTAALEWKPSGDNDQFDYVVTPGGSGITSSYVITVSYKKDPAISATVSKP